MAASAVWLGSFLPGSGRPLGGSERFWTDGARVQLEKWRPVCVVEPVVGTGRVKTAGGARRLPIQEFY